MRPACNINARGKFVRLVYGIVMMALGIAMLARWAAPDGQWWKWAISSVCFLGGAFALFEARAGWCIVRAMGFKTPV